MDRCPCCKVQYSHVTQLRTFKSSMAQLVKTMEIDGVACLWNALSIVGFCVVLRSYSNGAIN